MGCEPAGRHRRGRAGGAPWPQRWARGYFCFLFHRVKSKDLAIWFLEFCYLLRAGMNLAEAADSVAGKTRSRTLRRVAAEIARAAERGERPAGVMARWPCAFPRFVRSLVEVGFESGTIEGTFRRLADHYDRVLALEMLWRLETFYPKLLVLAVILIPGANAGALELLLTRCGWLSRFLTAIGFGSGQYGYLGTVGWLSLFVAAPLVSLLLGWRALRLLPGFAEAVDGMKLRLPWFGRIVRRGAMVRWARATAMLWEAGVPITRAVREGSGAAGNAAIERALTRHAPMLDDGQPLSAVLRASGQMTRRVMDMVITGERSGDLAGMLTRVAEYHELEAQTGHGLTAITVGATFFVVMAAIIGTMYLLFGLAMGGYYRGRP